MLEESGGCEVAVSRRIRTGWAKFRELAGVLLAKDIPRYLKDSVYKACVRPIALYGCDTWPLRIDEEKRLQRMERKMLRWTNRNPDKLKPWAFNWRQLFAV